MKISDSSFPHPVLGIRDDVTDSKFNVSFAVSLDPEEIKLKCDFDLTNNTLRDLIESKKAAFCTELNCLHTVFRQSFVTFSYSNIESVDARLLRNKVVATFFIVATEDIDKYQISGSNTEYQNYSFSIKKGDILAFGGIHEFIAEKDWRSLKGFDSFLIIDKKDCEKGPFDIYLSPEKIVVRLAKEDFERFYYYRSIENLPAIFHSSIVLPVLMYALREMIANEGQHEDARWYQILNYMKTSDQRFSGINWGDTDNIPQIAQIILDNPFNRTLDSIKSLSESHEGESEN